MTDPNPPVAARRIMPFDALLVQGRDLVCERLTGAVDDMYEKMDDTISALVNETQDPDTRKLYLETKDKALAQRKTIEENFRSHYLREFQVRSNRTKKTGQSFSELDSSSTELDLVGEDDLNETLKLNDMAAKLRQYCEEELAALDQRVGVLLGDANLEAEDNPFSPQAICDAFKHTCRKVDPSVKVRMVLLKLFDDHVLDDIRSVYKAVNALLVQNEILPRIRFRVARGQDSGKAPLPGAPAGDKAGAAVARAAEKSPGGEPDFFSVLQDLLANNVKAMSQPVPSAGSGAPVTQAPVPAGLSAVTGAPTGVPLAGAPLTGAPVVVLQGAELMNLLTRVQHGDANAAVEGGLPLTISTREPGTTNVLHELKASSVGTGMNQLDSMTLDIVAMLFDQLFDDPKIPIAVKGLIGRMQIPMLKVAIADKEFFSRKSHPARQLLDTLGEISSRLPSDFSSANPLFSRLEVLIQELMDNFQDNVEIFDKVRARLQNLMEEEDRRAEEETQLAARRIEQNESLAASKTMAEFEVKTRVEAGKLPRPVKEFLMHQWVKPLLIVHVRRGQHSDAWKNSLATMDLLTWSVAEKTTAEQRSKLAATIPDLLKRLAAGLKIADIDDEICERFFSELNGIHAELLSAEGEGKAAAPLDALESGLPPRDMELTLPSQSDSQEALEPQPASAGEPPVPSISFPEPPAVVPSIAAAAMGVPEQPSADPPEPREMMPPVTDKRTTLPELPPLEFTKPAEAVPPIPDTAGPVPELPPLEFTRPTQAVAPVADKASPVPELPPLEFPKPTETVPPIPAEATPAPVILPPDPVQAIKPIVTAGVQPPTPGRTPAAQTSKPIPDAPGPGSVAPRVPAQAPAQAAKPAPAAATGQGSTAPRVPPQVPAQAAKPTPAATGQGSAAPRVPPQVPAQAAKPTPAATGQGSAAPRVPPQVPAQAAKPTPAVTRQGQNAPRIPQAAAQATKPIAAAPPRAQVAQRTPVPNSAVRPTPPAAARAPAPVQAEEADSDSLDFTKVITIKNPFGGGKVQVQELESADARPAGAAPVKGGMNEVEFINNLKEGVWVEFHENAQEAKRPAKLSYISPLRSKFLFVDRAGKTVRECTRTELGRLVRLGMVVVVDVVVAEEPPLFDRMMAGVIGKLR